MKKRLFISSILMTLVLLVAITTATFAWYSATAGGSFTPSGKDAVQISASKDIYNVGGAVTFTTDFGGVEEEYTATKGNMPTYSTTFGHVHLTDDAGATNAWTAGGLVPQTVAEATDGGFSLGVAKVVFTLSSTDATNLSSVFAKLVADKNDSKTYDYVEYTFTLTRDGLAKVLGGAKPAKSGTAYAHADMVFILRLNSDGSYGLYKTSVSDGNKLTDTSGVWEIKFYYGMGTKYTTAQADVLDDHNGVDKIKVTMGSASWHEKA